MMYEEKGKHTSCGTDGLVARLIATENGLQHSLVQFHSNEAARAIFAVCLLEDCNAGCMRDPWDKLFSHRPQQS